MSDHNQRSLAPHEIIELHELLNTSVVEMKKMQASQSLVKDPDLASFIQDAYSGKAQRMREIQQFITSNSAIH